MTQMMQTMAWWLQGVTPDAATAHPDIQHLQMQMQEMMVSVQNMQSGGAPAFAAGILTPVPAPDAAPARRAEASGRAKTWSANICSKFC